MYIHTDTNIQYTYRTHVYMYNNAALLRLHSSLTVNTNASKFTCHTNNYYYNNKNRSMGP